MPDSTDAPKPASAGSKPVFNWEDPFDLVGQLTEDERMIAETAHAYAQDKLMPRVLESFRNETFDREIFNEMGELYGAVISHNDESGKSNREVKVR